MQKHIVHQIVGLAVCATVLTGCGQRQATSSNHKVANVRGMTDVYEVFLSDGTKCAVMAGPDRGGITCNWKANP